jgi:hypothetical protein
MTLQFQKADKSNRRVKHDSVNLNTKSEASVVYFDREQGLNELANDPEIFRPHHSENRQKGSYTIEPFGKKIIISLKLFKS